MSSAEVLTGGNTIVDAARILMALSTRAQERGDSNAPRIIYALERCVVRVGGPRRSGHTTAARRLADEHDGHALYLTPLAGMIRRDAFRDHVSAHWVYDLIEHPDRVRGLDCGLFIVDNASVVMPGDFRKVLEATIECTAGFPFFHYVLLG